MLGRTPVPQNVLRPEDRRAQRRHWLVMQIKRMLLCLLLISARQNKIYENEKQSDFICIFQLLILHKFCDHAALFNEMTDCEADGSCLNFLLVSVQFVEKLSAIR
jgi:hypothetical protein